MLRRPIVMILVSCLVVLGLVGCGGSNTGASNGNSNNVAPASTVSSSGLSPTPSLAPVPPHLTGVIVAVSPSSFSSFACGASTNIVFTATITIQNGSTGGTVPYTWTINHSNIAGSVNFAPGETSKTVTYTLSNYAVELGSASAVSGLISAGNGGGSINSSPVVPGGVCKLPGPFEVTGISISMSPTDISGLACGTTITAVYTATIYIAADSNGGTVNLTWTIGPSHFSTSASFGPTQTSQTVTRAITSVLSRTSGFPHIASIASTSPNIVSSGTVKAIGLCR